MNRNSVAYYIEEKQVPSSRKDEYMDRIKAKGMADMLYSRDIYQVAYEIISLYAEHTEDQYSVHILDVPDFLLSELTSLLMKENKLWANEATGPDNPAYEKEMLPALLKYLSNITDRDLEVDFKEAWTKGLTNYFTKEIEDILEQGCKDYTREMEVKYRADASKSLLDREINMGAY